MHALTLARQRLRARMENSSTPVPVRLAHGLIDRGRARFLPILSSSVAQSILSQGYDAQTVERIYANQPEGDLGPVGRAVDRMVLDLPVHSALRERLQAAVGEICAAIILGLRAGEPEFRLLSAPCGLAGELAGVASRLRERSPESLARLRCWGVDPDRDGTLLSEAARRTHALGLHAAFIREDLRRHREVRAVAEREGPFHLISCLGVSQSWSIDELERLVRFNSSLLAPGGTLLIDRWQPAEKSRLATGLGIEMKCHSAREFSAMLHGAGLAIQREHASGEGGCVLVVATKPAAETLS